VKGENIAELGYSKEYGRIELTVPYGTKFADLAKVREELFTDWLTRLPRGCPACHSGDSLFIRERLENVLLVDLQSMRILDER
jgi:hypothetical protein